jgi:2Fe-2S ferredoxin
MHTVRVEPGGHDITVTEGESLIEAAWRQGYVWPSTCFGQAECSTYQVKMVSSGESVAPVTEDEALHMIPLRDRVLRLARRLRITGAVVVEKRGVRVSDGTEEGR